MVAAAVTDAMVAAADAADPVVEEAADVGRAGPDHLVAAAAVAVDVVAADVGLAGPVGAGPAGPAGRDHPAVDVDLVPVAGRPAEALADALTQAC